ncbi:Rrp15p-domain-containing protein [Hyaloraphidium curvatum]|nr:Rrp15p-domain-containing protein [Hyaloraphidium curvatum]
MKKPPKAGDEGELRDAIAQILGKPLPKKQGDVVLRSSAAERVLDEKKLEAKAKKALAAEKKRAAASKRLGLASSSAEKEKALRKTATKGVVRLFNALREAQQAHGAPRSREGASEASASTKQAIPVEKFFDLFGGNGKPGHEAQEEHNMEADDVSLSDED